MADAVIAGVDEAGRGPLAGCVVAAAVILDPHKPIDGLNDSKRLSEKKRLYLAEVIKSDALAWSVASANVEEVDRLNIFWATMLAMQRAVKQLPVSPSLVKVDGNHCPELDCQALAVIGGDALVAEISAASILAKTTRDYQMLMLHGEYPEYRFDQHKGYPTKLHKSLLKEHGVTPHHRKSFAPVRELVERGLIVKNSITE